MSYTDELDKIADSAHKAQERVRTVQQQNKEKLAQAVEHAKTASVAQAQSIQTDLDAGTAKADASLDKFRVAWQEHVASTKARHAERKAKMDAKSADHAATHAEHYATTAVEIAISAIEEAEYAMLDAMLAREDADEAKASLR
jgi:hypothetical protein